MRRILFACFAALLGLAGWAGSAAAELASATSSIAATLPPIGFVKREPETAPDVLLSVATLSVFATLNQDRNLQSNNPEKFARLVESKVLPLFDFHHMTRLAVARNWRLASPEQQDALVAGFRTLLVRNYSTALTNYREQAIEYKPLRMAPGETDVTVKSFIKQDDAERMTIDYDMQKTSSGWKIYDVRVAGISLVSTYRSPFAETIRDGGVDALIEFIASRNQQPGPAPRVDEAGAPFFVLMYSAIQSFFRRDR